MRLVGSVQLLRARALMKQAASATRGGSKYRSAITSIEKGEDRPSLPNYRVQNVGRVIIRAIKMGFSKSGFLWTHSHWQITAQGRHLGWGPRLNIAAGKGRIDPDTALPSGAAF
jgi:hypothetical protein